MREEETHIGNMNAKLDEIVRQEKDLEKAPIFLHFDPCELDALFPNLSGYESGGELRLDARSAAEMALALKRDSADFFKAYADKFGETQGKQVLLTFAAQEQAHSDLIRQRMEEMLGKA